MRSRFGQTKPRRRRRGRGRGRELDRNHWEMYAAWRNKRKERGGKVASKKEKSTNVRLLLGTSEAVRIEECIQWDVRDCEIGRARERKRKKHTEESHGK